MISVGRVKLVMEPTRQRSSTSLRRSMRIMGRNMIRPAKPNTIGKRQVMSPRQQLPTRPSRARKPIMKLPKNNRVLMRFQPKVQFSHQRKKISFRCTFRHHHQKIRKGRSLSVR